METHMALICLEWGGDKTEFLCVACRPAEHSDKSTLLSISSHLITSAVLILPQGGQLYEILKYNPISLLGHLNIYMLYMNVLPAYVCVPCRCLELELHMAVNHHVALEIEPRCSRSNQCSQPSQNHLCSLLWTMSINVLTASFLPYDVWQDRPRRSSISSNSLITNCIPLLMDIWVVSTLWLQIKQA